MNTQFFRMTTFQLAFNLRTGNGFESYGRFELGQNRKFAYDLFSKLAGNEALAADDLIHIDLVEEKEALPVNIRVKSCAIQELGWNCKTITKEIFKFRNLDQPPAL
jgi:hypothetical protein